MKAKYAQISVTSSDVASDPTPSRQRKGNMWLKLFHSKQMNQDTFSDF